MIRMIVMAIVVAVLGVSGHMVHTAGLKAGRLEVQADWDAERASQAVEMAKATSASRRRDIELQAAMDKLQGESNEAIRRAHAERDSAVRELRNRASRPIGVPAAAKDTGATANASCRADQLYREDAQAALGIAADADIVRLSLLECRAAYEAAQNGASWR